MWDMPHRAAQNLPIHIFIPDHNEGARLELARVQPWREPLSGDRTAQGILSERANILLTADGPQDNTWTTPQRMGTPQYGTPITGTILVLSIPLGIFCFFAAVRDAKANL